MPKIEIIIDILGLAINIDTIVIEGIFVEIPEESKIYVAKIVVLKNDEIKVDVTDLVEEGRVCSLVDEVEVTSINDVLS